MSRVEENTQIMELVRSILEQKRDSGNDELNNTFKEIQIITLLDISRSLAVIADSMSK